MLFCSDKKGQVPQTLSRHHHWRSQVPRTELARRLLRPPKHLGQVPQTATQVDCCCHEVTETGTGERFTSASRPGPVQGWPWRGRWSPAGHRPQSVPWDPWPEARWAGGSWGEGQDLPYLIICLATTTPLRAGWMGHKRCLLDSCSFGEGGHYGANQ